MHRLDYNTSHSGGIITYLSSDIPRKSVALYGILVGCLVKGRIELQPLELSIKDEKWIVINMCKEPKTPNVTLQ